MKDTRNIDIFLDKNEESINNYYHLYASEIPTGIPDFFLEADGEQTYTFSNETTSRIVVGLKPYTVDDEKLQRMYIDALIGHEIQHQLSTTSAGWEYAINNGIREICLYIQSAKNINHANLLENKMSIIQFCKECNKNGIGISYDTLFNISRSVVNCIEDGRIERIRSYFLPAFRKKILAINYHIWDKGHVYRDGFPEDRNLHIFQLVMDNILTISIARHLAKGYESVDDDIADEVNRYLKEILPHIRKGVFAPDCRRMALESVEVCKILAKLILNFAEPDDDEDGDGADGNGDGNNENGNGDANNGNGGEGDGSNPGLNSLDDIINSLGQNAAFTNMIASNSSEQTGEDIPENFDVSDSGALGGDLEKTLNALENATEEEIKEAIKESMLQIDRNRKRPHSQIKREVFGKESALPPTVIPLIDSYGEFEEITRPYSLNNKLPRELVSLGEDLKRRVTEALTTTKNIAKNRKSGKVLGNSVYRLGMNDVDIFANRDFVPADAVCYILSDNSGSMGDGDSPRDNRYHSLRALSVIEYGFGDYIPMKITSFNTAWLDKKNVGGTKHIKIKDFNERVSNNSSYNFLVECGCEGANDDAYSIAIASRELQARSEKNKILFVLSDGCPCCNEEFVTKEVKEARANGITVIPIFFGRDCEREQFKELYVKDYIFAKPEELGVKIEEKLREVCF